MYDPQAELAAEYYSDDVNERFAGERIPAGWGMAEGGGDVEDWPVSSPAVNGTVMETDTPDESDLELLYGHPMTPDLPF